MVWKTWPKEFFEYLIASRRYERAVFCCAPRHELRRVRASRRPRIHGSSAWELSVARLGNGVHRRQQNIDFLLAHGDEDSVKNSLKFRDSKVAGIAVRGELQVFTRANKRPLGYGAEFLVCP